MRQRLAGRKFIGDLLFGSISEGDVKEAAVGRGRNGAAI